MAKIQRTNNDLQNTTKKTKDQATRTLLKTGGGHKCSGRVLAVAYATIVLQNVTFVWRFSCILRKVLSISYRFHIINERNFEYS